MATDRIEPFVNVDIAALRVTTQTEVFSGMEKGFTLAEEHCAITQEHIIQNGFDFDHPFWGEISAKAEEALGDDPLTQAAYRVIVAKFQAAVRDANPLEVTALEHDIASRRGEGKSDDDGDDDESNPFEVVDIAAIAGPDGEAIIDRMAASHGHLTREDECESIQILRSLRKRLTNPDADGA